MNINVNEETIEIIYQSIMGLWYYLPAYMVYKFFAAPKVKPRFEHVAFKCKKYDKDPAKTFEAKVLRKRVRKAA